MALNYDIDILPEDKESLGLFVAAFRDPATAQAARDADPRIGALLEDAGISLEPSSSNVPAGHYAYRDAGAREYVAACLDAAMRDDDETPRRDHTTEFDISELAKAVATAQPFGPIVAIPAAPERTPMKVGVAFGIMAFAGYLAGFSGLM
ncbi:MAG: hypothetical protein AAFM92_12485 [Pseudomonadota bacterium]